MRNRLGFFLNILVLISTLVLIGWKLWKPIVLVALPPEKNVPIQVYGLGTLEAHTLSKIGFKISGILVKLNADHGDRVKKGDILVQLDTAEQAKPAGELILGSILLTFVKDSFHRHVIMPPEDAMLLGLVVVGVCLLASELGVRLAQKIDADRAAQGKARCSTS